MATYQETDYQKIRDENSLIDLVAMYVGGQSLQYKKPVRCPLHNEKTPSFSVRIDERGNEQFACFGACAVVGDVVKFLELAERIDHGEAIARLTGQVEYAPPKPRNLPKPPPEEPKPLPYAHLIDEYHQSMETHHYQEWHDLGITPSTIRKFKVGWSGSRYTFGWYGGGELRAIKMRKSDRFSGHLKDKYISYTGSRFISPYNIDSIRTPIPPRVVLIVEDEKSAMMAYQYGYMAISIPANGFKRAWLGWLNGIRWVIFVADNDEAGQKSGEAFGGMCKRAKVVAPPKEGEIKDLFDYAAHYNHLRFLIEEKS